MKSVAPVLAHLARASYRACSRPFSAACVEEPTKRPSMVQVRTDSSSFASRIAASRSGVTFGTLPQKLTARTRHQRIRASYVIGGSPSTANGRRNGARFQAGGAKGAGTAPCQGNPAHFRGGQSARDGGHGRLTPVQQIAYTRVILSRVRSSTAPEPASCIARALLGQP